MRKRYAAIASAALSLLTAVGCDEAAPDLTPPPADTPEVYEHRVEGFGTYAANRADSIQYRDANGVVQTVVDVTLPWNLSVRFEDAQTVDLYLRAKVTANSARSGLGIYIDFEGETVNSREEGGSSSSQLVTNDLEMEVN